MSDPVVELPDVGFTALATSPLSVEQTSRIAATFDLDPPPGAGDPLPLLWHWAHFDQRVATSALGPDGHPHVPGELAARFPRRMWASGWVEGLAPLLVGEPVERRSRIARTKESEGRSGSLLIVDVEHTYRQGGEDRRLEGQTLVYRAPGPPASSPDGDVRPEPDEGGWAETVTMGPVPLFRYSAITFNSHRIHYDQTFAREVEGYPDLVVHGPLTATLLCDAVARHAGRPVTRFDYRANAPLFADLPFTLLGTPDGDEVAARVIRNDGAEAVAATARLAPAAGARR